MEHVLGLITQEIETMVEGADPYLIQSKWKAIWTLFPYAVCLERGDQQGIVSTISRAAKVSKSVGFVWRHLDPYIATLIREPSSPSLNWVVVLVAPNIRWEDTAKGQSAVVRWAAAALAVRRTEEVCRDVVNTLLQIASNISLQLHIPIEVWACLKKVRSLPPVCLGRYLGTTGCVVRHVRGLGDVEVLKSYFLLVWSEWDSILSSGYYEMETSIREDFYGIGMYRHREDLIRRLDHVLGQLDRGSEYLKQHKPWIDDYHILTGKGEYGRLREVLLEVEREAMNTLIRALLDSFLFNEFTDRAQNPTPPLPVLYPFHVCDFEFGPIRVTLHGKFCAQLSSCFLSGLICYAVHRGSLLFTRSGYRAVEH